MAIAVTFPTLYLWLTTIVEDLTGKVIKLISKGMKTDFSAIITEI
nr:conjugal transfer protein TrbL family protein [Clostridium acetireducens]